MEKLVFTFLLGISLGGVIASGMWFYKCNFYEQQIKCYNARIK